MPRPTTEKDPLTQSRTGGQALNALLDRLSPADHERAFKPGMKNRHIRDVLAHPHHGHLLFLDRYAVGMTGDEPHMPAKGYRRARNGQLNEAIHAQWSITPMKTVIAKLKRSHAPVHAIINEHSEAELFTKQQYACTGTPSWAAYLTGATCSHYAWAIQLIRKGLVVPGQ